MPTPAASTVRGVSRLLVAGHHSFTCRGGAWGLLSCHVASQDLPAQISSSPTLQPPFYWACSEHLQCSWSGPKHLGRGAEPDHPQLHWGIADWPTLAGAVGRQQPPWLPALEWAWGLLA